MRETIITEYKNFDLYLSKYSNILFSHIKNIEPSILNGSGYVINSLESSLYSFMTTNNYKKSIETAISIGMDTDTIACITGGLSGLYYGFNNIPSAWVQLLVKKDEIIKTCRLFKESL